jgi:hypothetical protein
MAFDRNYLTKVGPSGGKAGCLWMYRTTDASTAVDAAGYFNNASDVLQIGDVIMVATVTGVDAPTAVSTVFMQIVNANASGVVDVTDGIAITATDSD